jgi:hypothetical protein
LFAGAGPPAGGGGTEGLGAASATGSEDGGGGIASPPASESSISLILPLCQCAISNAHEAKTCHQQPHWNMACKRDNALMTKIPPMNRTNNNATRNPVFKFASSDRGSGR